MYDTIRDSSFGQALRFVTGNKTLLFPDELPNFELPSPTTEEKKIDYESEVSTITNCNRESKGNELDIDEELAQRADIEPIERTISRPIHPVMTSDGIILIDWYATGKFCASWIPESHWIWDRWPCQPSELFYFQEDLYLFRSCVGYIVTCFE